MNSTISSFIECWVQENNRLNLILAGQDGIEKADDSRLGSLLTKENLKCDVISHIVGCFYVIREALNGLSVSQQGCDIPSNADFARTRRNLSKRPKSLKGKGMTAFETQSQAQDAAVEQSSCEVHFARI